jgi:hypothetical protein
MGSFLQFSEIAHFFGYILLSIALIFTKMHWATIWAKFFTFSSGRPACVAKQCKKVLPFAPKPIPGRVARWYIFKPKIRIWVNFGGP